MGQLSRKEDKKLAALQKEIPVSIQEDLLQRRQKTQPSFPSCTTRQKQEPLIIF